jgi:uncharacterized membrane protein YbaN (DUF454 family)
MTEIDTAGARAHKTAPPDPDDGLGQPTAVPPDSWRERIRARPVLGQCYRVGVFVAGLLCIALGFALAVLPGPLTIPPVLLGLWIWSTEFRFAERLFDSFKSKAKETWSHAKARPASSAAITIGGLAAAGAAMWAVSHFELVAKSKDALGV